MKTLILYIFHEYNERVKIFLEKCIFEDEKINFIIICNDLNYNLEVPKYVKLINRENKGYDFGGWSDALLIDNLYEDYDNFIFINSSVVGPFLKNDELKNWPNYFLSKINNDVKLFGSSINTCSKPHKASHVQSYLFCMNKETLKFLIDKEIFTMKHYTQTMRETIQTKEILMSRLIIKNNWNIGCLYPECYADIDFRFKNIKYEDLSEKQKNYLKHKSLVTRKKALLDDFDVYKLIFVKGNRDLEINYKEIK